MFRFRRKSFIRRVVEGIVRRRTVKVFGIAIIAFAGWMAEKKDGQLSSFLNDNIEAIKGFVTENKQEGKESSFTSSEEYNNFECLASSDYDYIIQHTGFTVSYDMNTNTPKWVAWELTKEETYGVVKRTEEFLPDPKVDMSNRVTTEDYKGSGYDRGHICPAADMKWSVEAMHDCFYMTNICPQNHNLNRKAWERLEEQCRQWAREYGKIYITAGPIYEVGNHKVIGKNCKVTVPEGFYKVVMVPRKGEEKAIGFFYSNDDKKQTMRQCALPVDMIEKITGIDFFYNVDMRVQDRIEKELNIEDWGL